MKQMNGQWIGSYAGASEGEIIVNVDDRGSHFRGIAYLHETDSRFPSTVAVFRTSDKNSPFEFRAGVFPLDDRTNVAATWDAIKDRYDPNLIAGFSAHADVTGSWTDSTLTLQWKTDIEVEGNAILPRSKADQPSELAATVMSWDDFKRYVSALEGRRYLFRGQNGPWRLRTSFHRRGRADLVRFINEDIVGLYKHLSARTKHVFNLGLPEENGAFYNLVQHHGYPTPLLDWSYSPYVAAFFAYRKTASERSYEDKVRIVVLDQAEWRADWNQPLFLSSARLYVSIEEFLAIENERMIPQQASSMITNVDDIESYVRLKESNGKTYLSAIDLPLADRKQVVRELGYMGITAGSLFPGLDGACEELAERNFE